jgi:hypothetical protein
LKTEQRTLSLWKYIHANIATFTNKQYHSSPAQTFLQPNTDRNSLQLWRSYYLVELMKMKELM